MFVFSYRKKEKRQQCISFSEILIYKMETSHRGDAFDKLPNVPHNAKLQHDYVRTSLFKLRP